MISKIQANSSNVNFQAKVFPDWRAGAYLKQHPELAQNKPFKEQIKQLIANNNSDIVFINGLVGTYEEGIKLTVLTKNNLWGSKTINNLWKTEPYKIDLIKMYNDAKNDICECTDDYACFDLLNVCG